LLIQQALREIVTKIASNPLVKTRYRSSVWPDFIGEMTRVGTNQGVSRQKLAKQLNAKKVPAFAPSKWDQSTIHNMLRFRATIGEHQPKRIRNGKRVPDDDPIPGFYPAAIDESLFDAAQEARQNNLASGRGRKGKPLTNLFRGIPTCAYCASRVLFKSKST
jgi:hypothetical protein